MEDNDCFVQIPHKHPLENKKKNQTLNPCVFIYEHQDSDIGGPGLYQPFCCILRLEVNREAEDQREHQ